MKHKKILTIVLSLMLVGSSYLVPSAFGQTKSYSFSLSTFFPAPHRNTAILTEWTKEIEKRTNGAVKITIFPGGTLTPADKCYDGVVRGISDFGNADLAYTRGRFPLTEVFYLPLGIKSALVATRMVNEFYAKFQPKELDETKIMFFICHGPGLVHTKKPVRTLEELKGMKIRSTGMSTKIVLALGATPVAMPMGDAYDALSRGVTEGIVCPYEALYGWKLGEVIKSTTEDYPCAYFSAFFITMNKDKWNALPPDIQKIIESVNREYIDKAGKAWDEIDKQGKDFTVKLGNQIIPLSKEEGEKWTKAGKPLLDEYVTAMKAKGLPGEEALKFCIDYLKKNQ
jgi:TRAP-type C4-dicarboxylate transport system substrate-binding protein